VRTPFGPNPFGNQSKNPFTGEVYEQLSRNPMQFRLRAAPIANISASLTEPRRYDIVASGRVMPDTDAQFNAFLNDNSQWVGPGTTVILNSIGGNLGAGMQMGRTVRRRGFLTSVMLNQSKDQTHYTQACASSCNFIFMGGVRRTVRPGALFVSHQFSRESNPDTMDLTVRAFSAAEVARASEQTSEWTQAVAGEVAEFLHDMGIDARFLRTTGKIPNEKPTILPTGILATLNIVTSNATTEWSLVASKAAKGFELNGTTAKQLKPNLVDRVSLLCENQKLRMVVYYFPDRSDLWTVAAGVSDWDGAMESLVRRATGILLDELEPAPREHVEFRRPDLKFLGVTDLRHVAVEVPVTADVEKLWRGGRKLQVSIGIGRADPATTTRVDQRDALAQFTTDMTAGRQQIDSFMQACR
jgi:hypothetical protein